VGAKPLNETISAAFIANFIQKILPQSVQLGLDQPETHLEYFIYITFR
jgi:hypothetical protein